MDFDKCGVELKKIIDEEGIEYLSRESYGVYESLYECTEVPALCRCVLSVLLAGIMEHMEGAEPASLSSWIQKHCFYKKNVADGLAAMFVSLFSEENREAWSDKADGGFREFCNREWEYKFHGEHTWHHGGGTEDCWVDIEMDFAVKKPELFRALIAKELDRNPFLTEDAIYEFVSKKLDNLLQTDIEEYAETETYYEPYMEDYGSNGEYTVKEFFKKYGMKIIYFECDGSESGFEPDSRW